MKAVCSRTPPGSYQFFDEATRAKLTVTPAGEIGNTGRNFFNLAPTFNMDARSRSGSSSPSR